MPTVVLATEKFVGLAETTKKSKGVPGLPVVVFPEDTDTTSKEHISQLTQERLKDITAHLVADEDKEPHK